MINQPGVKCPYHGEIQRIHGLGPVQSDDGHPVLNIYQEITAVAAAAVAGGHFSVESAQTADGLREEGFYEILWYHIHLEIAEVYMRLIYYFKYLLRLWQITYGNVANQDSAIH